METDGAAIPVRSRKQALDWSLVLISQEIENVIQPPGEEHGWQLLVSEGDYSRALATLEQYRAENRFRRWRQELPVGGLVFDWRSVIWFILPVVFYCLSETSQTYLPSAGMMDTEKVQAGQWWRLFTAMLLHGDPPHLVTNVTFGVLLLGLAMGSFGPGLALLGAYLAGAGGNLVLIFIYPHEHRSLGASGMVLGALGLLAGQSLALLRAGSSARQFIVPALVGGVLLLVLLGLSPTSDVVAHVGGFGAGVFLGGLLAWLAPKLAQNPRANWLAEALCGLLVLLTWWLALRG